MNDVVKQDNRPVINTQTQSISPMSLIQTAMSADMDLDKLERLMDMEERHNARQAQMEFNKALAEFQRVCPVIKTMKKGHNNMYAPLSDIVAQVKNPLSECGLSYRFKQSEEGNNITVTCVVTHLSGHSEETSMTGAPDTGGSKQAIQAKASTVTYLRRYTMTGALGIVTGDADTDGRVDASNGVSANDKTWIRAIKSGSQSLEDITDETYRAHIKMLLEQAQ